jgi:hypothetical protein
MPTLNTKCAIWLLNSAYNNDKQRLCHTEYNTYSSACNTWLKFIRLEQNWQDFFIIHVYAENPK